jgi:hypothetical protein
MNQELVQESIDEVMDNFDWEKVHRVMQAIDWKWYHADGEIVTPSISDLRRTARRLLRNVVEGLRIHEQYSAASGFMPKDIQTQKPAASF